MNNQGQSGTALIRDRLNQEININDLKIIDDSHMHSGHHDPKAGGHFSIEVVSDDFKNKSAIERHRMIYSALGTAIGQEIHALSISAKTPEELNQDSTS